MQTTWKELQWPVRISLITGLVGACACLLQPFRYGWTILETPLSLALYAVFFLPFPVLLTVLTMLLLFRNMSIEKRGILGFLELTVAIPTMFYGPYMVLWLLILIRPFGGS